MKPSLRPQHHAVSGNAEVHVDDSGNSQSLGIYLQSVVGHIRLGRRAYIPPNVGIITVESKSACLG